MFDWVYAATSAWREVMRVSEFTGLSIGMLALLAAIVYFIPTLRGFAIRCAIAVIAGYVLAIFCYHAGASDKQAQWTAANKRVATAIVKRDADAATSAGIDEKQRASQLASDQSIDQGIIDALKARDATCHPITGAQLR